MSDFANACQFRADLENRRKGASPNEVQALECVRQAIEHLEAEHRGRPAEKEM